MLLKTDLKTLGTQAWQQLTRFMSKQKPRYEQEAVKPAELSSKNL